MSGSPVNTNCLYMPPNKPPGANSWRLGSFAVAAVPRRGVMRSIRVLGAGGLDAW
jgi:hypothetical protein